MCQPLRCLTKLCFCYCHHCYYVINTSVEMRPKRAALPGEGCWLGVVCLQFCRPHPTSEETGFKFPLGLTWGCTEGWMCSTLKLEGLRENPWYESPHFMNEKKKKKKLRVVKWFPKVTQPVSDGNRTQSGDVNNSPYIAPSSPPHSFQPQCPNIEATGHKC